MSDNGAVSRRTNESLVEFMFCRLSKYTCKRSGYAGIRGKKADGELMGVEVGVLEDRCNNCDDNG